jgi:hypothetical protein
MTLITKTILEIPDLADEPDTPEAGTAYAYVHGGTFTVKLDDDSTKSLQISDITAGDGITIDRTDPANPVISADDSGHTILDPDGTALAQEAKLQFLGNVHVTDDSSAGSTKVTVAGEGLFYKVPFTAATPFDGSLSIAAQGTATQISGPLGSDTAPGLVQGDGTTISITDGIATALGGGGSVTNATNYWPTDTLCFRSSYAQFTYMAGDSGLCGPDGWFIYQPNPNVTSNQRVYWRTNYTQPTLGEGTLQYLRQTGNTTTGLCTMNRPFTIRETHPIWGQTVTLSFDYNFGTGFPRNQAGNGMQLDLFYAATTDPSINIKIDTDGTFKSNNATLATLPEIVDGPTDGTFARYSQTFAVPANALQICLRIRHLPPSATGVSGYTFALRHPTIHLGNQDLGFAYPLRGVEDGNWGHRYCWVETGFFGPVTSGQVVKLRCTFPTPLEYTPNCLRCDETYTTTAFPTGTYADVSEITNSGFTVTRTANGDSDSGRFRANYKFGCILHYPFTDPIPNF